jgi:GNAT superfamily N-acetyltransferase
MPDLSNVLSRPHAVLRGRLCAADPARIEALVRAVGVFNPAEIAIARELVEETLARGGDAAGYYFLIADQGDAIAGYACYGPILATENRFELYWIAVSPAARRGGLGQQLMAAAEAGARAKGASHLFAEASDRADSQPVHAFYRACGYILHARVPDYHADGDGLAIFGKRL